MQVLALSSIEGSRNSENPIIAPGTVFDVDDDTSERLLAMSAVRKASKEDVALAKVKGLLIESKPATETKASAASTKAKAETKPAAAQADDTL